MIQRILLLKGLLIEDTKLREFYKQSVFISLIIFIWNYSNMDPKNGLNYTKIYSMKISEERKLMINKLFKK